ncbi:hypothetical protein CJF30_00007878 [Rutstroemia sp. NJR-2017a BBW]|nr:hypothetical protein CJF30_00007878 [Rutstroemia sp. NJR-2017a BBW]
MNSLNILSGRGSPQHSAAPSRSNSLGNVLTSATLSEPRRNSQGEIYSEKSDGIDDAPDSNIEDDTTVQEYTPLLNKEDTSFRTNDHVGITRWLYDTLRWVLSTLAAPGVYVIACLYDERGNFAPISRFASLFGGGDSTTQSMSESGGIGHGNTENHSSKRRGSLMSKSTSPYSSSSISSESESEYDRSLSETDKASIKSQSRQTRSKSLQSSDDISPARRSIRIKLHNEDNLRQRKHRKAQSTNTPGDGSRASSASEVTAANLKSPTSPASSLLMTKYPRVPAPPRPLIPRRQPSYTLDMPPGKFTQKTLVLDLDETLIHSMAQGGRMSTGHMVEVQVTNLMGPSGAGPQHPILYYVHKRPYCDDFLRRVCKWYNLVVFTASLQDYADPVIDWLEQELRNGAYIKDLSSVEPDLSKVMILDNSPTSYLFHQEGWINDPTDNDLLHLVPLLEGLQRGRRVRQGASRRQNPEALQGVEIWNTVGTPYDVEGHMLNAARSNQDIVNQGVLEVSNKMLYDVDNGRKVIPNGPLDPRMGTSSKTGFCDTCGDGLQNCNGHFGHVRLALPVFHIGYLKLIINILQNICKDCARVLLTDAERRHYLKELRRPGIDNLKRTQICKKLNEQCRKASQCPHCGATNGQIRKVSVVRLAHDKYTKYNKSTAAKKVVPPGMAEYQKSFEEAKKHNTELEKHTKKAMEDLHPLRVLNLFKLITPSDCELLGINPAEGRPEMFLWQFIPAPPICIRPSVAQDNASTEDDLTSKLGDIVQISALIRAALQKGQPVQTVMEQWDYLQLQVAMYVNSDVPGLQQPGFGKTIRGFCQRLKGKQGRFRGNLSGKRVDFSGRTVISPDPNLGIDQVAVPILVAKNLTYPERVQRQNIEKLRKCVLNGPNVHPGAQQIIKKDSNHKISLKFAKRDNEAKYLKIGDVVERHLEDGDIVLFNRQPSLHKLSIMSHYAKIRPWRTFRLNECVCNPYNADFDGDEMNLHVPQTEEARTEAINLMGVKNNLSTPKNGEPIISATQDFITAAYLLSSKENFFDRRTFTNLCMYMVNGDHHLDLPPPAILKPQALWTGKQVFSMMMRPNKASNVLVNVDAKCRDFNPKDQPKGWARDMEANDGWLVVRNSVVMCGLMDKSTVGSGKKDSIFYVILRDYGPDAAVIAMNRLSKLSARYLTNMGFSIGINDVYPSETLNRKKAALISAAYKECERLIREFQFGTLEKATGRNMEETLEDKISGVLSKVRAAAGEECLSTLSKFNSPLVMAKSGSKGSALNVAQMVAVVGQQIIGGARVADGFQDRTLPHFSKHSRQPAAKGFVSNSFFTGLTPYEFLFHAISGREGLVDTAVKTAETGYMSRRLMKSLEDLSTQYDDTVRTSGGGIVQFQFGADGLDPLDMEGNAVPVNFERTWLQAENLTWKNADRSLLPYEVTRNCTEHLAQTKATFVRKGLRHGEPLSYDDSSDYGVDEHDGGRGFLAAITKFIGDKATRMAKARQRVGLHEFEDDPEETGVHYDETKEDQAARDYVDRVAKISEATLRKFCSLCLEKYAKAKVEPGHAVGAVGAQSIGEPGTQMTLKTFHFAGVAGMNLTAGVPRIKEIINASKTISTPFVDCPLIDNTNIKVARRVKALVEKTFLSDVLHFAEDMWSARAATICLAIDTAYLRQMQINVGVEEIAQAILKNKKLKIKSDDLSVNNDCIFIRVTHDSAGPASGRGAAAKNKPTLDEGGSDLLLRVNHLKRALPTIAISGYPEATRAIINTSEKEPVTYKLIVEGYGLRACLGTEGVDGTKARSNSVMEMKDVLGIEAARHTIAAEIALVMADMGIDPRHMQLLADVMTYKGEVLGITRFGLSKMRDSVLQLASFEKTPDHLFDAAAGMKSDKIEGVSECIIMGQTMSVGTGAFKVVRELHLTDEDLKVKPTLFEDAWKWDQTERKKAKLH